MFQAFARRTAAVVVLVAISSPSLAGSASKRDPGTKVVCKVERSSTSRIAVARTCKTASEWDIDHKRNETLQADRENMLLRNPQDSSGTLGVPADLRATPN